MASELFSYIVVLFVGILVGAYFLDPVRGSVKAEHIDKVYSMCENNGGIKAVDFPNRAQFRARVYCHDGYQIMGVKL